MLSHFDPQVLYKIRKILGFGTVKSYYFGTLRTLDNSFDYFKYIITDLKGIERLILLLQGRLLLKKSKSTRKYLDFVNLFNISTDTTFLEHYFYELFCARFRVHSFRVFQSQHSVAHDRLKASVFKRKRTPFSNHSPASYFLFRSFWIESSVNFYSLQNNSFFKFNNDIQSSWFDNFSFFSICTAFSCFSKSTRLRPFAMTKKTPVLFNNSLIASSWFSALVSSSVEGDSAFVARASCFFFKNNSSLSSFYNPFSTFLSLECSWLSGFLDAVGCFRASCQGMLSNAPDFELSKTLPRALVFAPQECMHVSRREACDARTCLDASLFLSLSLFQHNAAAPACFFSPPLFAPAS